MATGGTIREHVAHDSKTTGAWAKQADSVSKGSSLTTTISTLTSAIGGSTPGQLAGLLKRGSKCPETKKDANGNETYVSTMQGELIVGMVFHDDCKAANCPLQH